MERREIIPTPLFLSDYKQLKKKFPSIRNEINNFEEFMQNPQNKLLGVPVPGLKNVNGNKVFKYRMPNKSANKGRSGGFRLIYYYMTSGNTIFLLTIYSKTHLEDIPSHVIDQIIKKYFDKV
ncbi:hypothetical protein [Lentibacillus salinarum]|uniref:Addiction module toxin RelE n=1 Tax=Lentibacillus salinarum TaxID=446820 RepID=A0ABW3ZU82_9BACI